jgi:PAS domain S-box-containing protein
MEASDVPPAAHGPIPVHAPCLLGGGEMGARMRTFDWSTTPLGRIEAWPQSLKTAVQIILNSRYPMFIWWGASLTNLYNDAYAPILGRRHPQALGQPASAVWADVWGVVGPQAEAVLYEGRASWNQERLLIMERHGYPEETYFTFSYSPITDDTGGVGGVFCAVTEDTTRVLGERRLRTLRELSALTADLASAFRSACERASLKLSVHCLPLAVGASSEHHGRRNALAQTQGAHPRVVWADDNADMRDYVCRLLDDRFEVEAVVDGQAALEAARRQRPDLVLSDVMTPRLDGLALLRELRADPHLREVPVILLSARAGEEVRVEGIEAGADDYLVKPFSARELVARVETHVKIARLRRESEGALRQSEERFRLAQQVAGIGTFDWHIVDNRNHWSPELLALYGVDPEAFEGTYEAWLRRLHPDDAAAAEEAVRRALASGRYDNDFRVIRPDGTVRWLQARGEVLYDEVGRPFRIVGINLDITARKLAEAEAERRRHEAEVVAQITQTLTASLDLDIVLQRVAAAAQELSASERALIFLREPGAETFSPRYQVGSPVMPFADLRIVPGRGIGGRALQTGSPVRTANYAEDPDLTKDYLLRMRAAGQLAVITVPITIGSRVEGLLYVSNSAAQPFTAREEDVLRRLADFAATAIRNAQLYQDVHTELSRRTQAETQLMAALHEKEVLLKEIHHRVKNNLQVISSLLSLQRETLPDLHLQAAFEDSQQRIQAMALVHESLYQSRDLGRIDFAAYVDTLSHNLLRSASHDTRHIALRLELEPVLLDIERAIPCGLILNELLTNALKHAFPEGRPGTVAVGLQATEDQVILRVSDTGVGLPVDLDFRQTDSLGMQLVCLLTEQLGGTITCSRDEGTAFTLTLLGGHITHGGKHWQLNEDEGL